VITARRASLAILGVALVALMVHTGSGLGGAGLDGFFLNWVYTIVEVGATGLCVWRAIAVREERAAWLTLAAYMVAWTVADLLWTVWLNHVPEVTYPNLTDYLYLGSYGFAYAGLLLLLRARLRPFNASLWLDGLVVGLALAAVCAAVVFGPVLAATEGGGWLTVLVTLAYPVCDLLLLCFVGLAFGMTGGRPGRAWTFLAISLLLTAAADGIWAYAETTGAYDPSAFYTTLWPAAMLAMAVAAWQPRRRGTVRQDGLAVIAVPAAFALIALGLLLYSQLRPISFVAAALAVVALLAAGARGTLTFRENVALLRRSRQEALTDALSGLGNRRRLMQDIDEALAIATESRPYTLVFFDLDGFKGYNDSFGHSAGDMLLARLGRQLAMVVTERGEAYRLGGDEFCVLLGAHAERDDAIVALASKALSEHGEGFSIGASYGIVSLPGDADTATIALQLADERMYAEKDSRRGSTRRQARDLLMQILKEREPPLHRHMDDVAVLAVAVARRLGFQAEGLDEVARAAELHDVGKVAVPDAILHKPDGLDELEWQLMRQHTVVGERILAAAPALRPVAKLVRSSHERWDGGGYPDNLAGTDIPLGARIIAVCDAFDAMTSDRPYRAGATAEEALAELRRCAGSQFDPAVVDVFVAVVEAGEAGERDALRA
jgi:two-component system, cell cycle response regulator